MEVENNFSFQTIGRITRSSFKEKFGTPRQGVLNPESKAFIELNPQLPTGALEGLEGFSHIWLISVFHANENTKIKGKVFAPKLNGESIGVLASRSPHRPNPIGLSLAKIESIETKGVWVSGIDLIEGTPILDIKPYIQEDILTDAKVGWTSFNEIPTRKINWVFDPVHHLNEMSIEEAQKFKTLTEATLRLDPRPVIYKKLEAEQAYEGPYGIRLEDYNVKFISKPNAFEIIEITRASLNP